jgi:hypothetical protein
MMGAFLSSHRIGAHRFGAGLVQYYQIVAAEALQRGIHVFTAEQTGNFFPGKGTTPFRQAA